MSEIEIPAGVSPGVADIVRQFNAEDPAVRTWAETLAASADQAASTSALLRRLTDEADRIRADYNAVLLERDAIAAHLRKALDGNTALSFDHAKVLIAVDRLTRENAALRARIARQPGAYQLTDKGLAATEETHG